MGFTSPRTSPEYIFTAGILVNNFKEDKLEVSVLKKIETYVLEWLKLAQEQDLCVHFPIFLGIVKTLSHAGFYLSCRKLIEEFKRSSFSNLRGLLDVEVLLCRCLLEIHEVDQLPLNLKNSGILFKTAYTGIASEYDDLINMKLMQLEFFINMCDQDKSIVKFDEVKSMIASRTEYNLSIESRDISLQRRLTIFATISRFSLLASRLSMILAQVSESLRNSKLSIKLLCSVLRKIDSLSGFDNMKTEATHLLLKGYELAFTASKRLGLSKDAIHFVDEFTKLNSSLCRSPIKSLNNFIGANYLMYANKKSDALRQFEMGRSDTWHSKFLNLIELVTCISVNFDLMSAECLESKRKDVISLLFARQDSNDSSQFVVPASQISGILLDVESLVIKIFGKGFSEDQQDSTNIFEMLTKAVLSVQLKLSEVEDSSAICNVIQMLDSSIEYLPNTGQIDFNTFRESALSISVINHCKDVLMRCGEGKYLRYLEIGTMHEINTLLNRFGFLLSFFGSPQQDDLKELLKTSFLIKDLAYSLPYDNQKALMTTQIFSAAAPLLPECGNAQNGKSIQDLKEKFYEDLLQLLPVSWTVVTLDICQVSGDLIISRLWAEADYPIVFKVPFDRREENKRNFNEYLRELKSIIADSNLSTKSTVTSAIKTKEDRKMWWKMRFELDSRLGALLQQIERSTIGGLVGVFGNFDTKVEECRIFEMELNKIWNAALGHTQETVQLDKTIVGLFYFALLYGQSGMSGFDLLADLTVYTAEQLQLHTRLKSGFVKDNDWIISHVSRLCVTRPYHNDTDHLILIPSHTCSYVPWESMTCLRGRSVSRMPSVSHLFESLARHKDQMKVYKDGSENLLYVVNPGSDLIKTQNRFKPVFDGLLGANGVAGEPPSEEWLTANLYRSNLYVYLGHGGGEQYLRSSALFNSKSKTEEQLPTTLLMGCSSSAYQEHGRLQPSSNIFNWLVCGAPAVMTNLWDITDKDIDIFSLSFYSSSGESPQATLKTQRL
ncbi:hypothetical protein JCM33374_g155 [Metschnikowia sp. JCM 33374]|nr:hypothetical protein JCM33374_g155 [Metschnikowia sp. JCM 33374]